MASGSSQSSRASSAPWVGQQEFLTDLYQRASGFSNEAKEFFPQSTVAGRDATTQAGIDTQGSRALSGSSGIGDAVNLNRQTLRGDFLNSNPHLNATFDSAADRLGEQFQRIVQPGIASRFGGSRRLGSGAEANAIGASQDILGDQLGDLATSIFGQNFQNERQLQSNAANIAPNLAQSFLAEPGQATQAGLQNEQFQQRVLQDLIDRFNFSQDEEGNRLAEFSNLIGQPAITSKSSSSGTSIGIGGG